MRRKAEFRPAVTDVLEDRTVPSGFFDNLIASVPAQDAQKVEKSFETFEQSYTKDVQTILLPSGTTTPASNRAAFDTQVGTDLTTLNTSIDTIIANLPTATNPTLSSTIQSDLLGTATTSLQGALAAIASPTSTSRSATRSFLHSADSAIGQTDFQVTKLVRNATPPAGTVTNATAQTLISAINTAFGTFSQGYFNAVQATATAPSTNRSAFDAAVGTLLTTLNTSVGTAITAASLPSSLSTSLATTLTNDLLTGTSTTGTSLQARLAALTSPTSTGFATWFFDLRSFRTILGGQSQVVHDVVSAINTYNSSL
jgi:hypothetical protein